MGMRLVSEMLPDPLSFFLLFATLKSGDEDPPSPANCEPNCADTTLRCIDYKLLPNKENPDASPDTLERCLKIIYGIANNFIGVDPKNANRGLYNIAEPPTSVDDLAHTGTQPDSTKPGYIVQG